MVLRLFLFSLVLSLSGCFWNSEKDTAIAAVKQKIEEDLFTEARPTLESKPIFHKRFVSIISNKTEMDVESENEVDGITTVVVNVKTISEFGRYNLKEVFAKQNESRDTNFNGTEALGMILKMVKKDSEKYARQSYTVVINSKKNSEVLSVKKHSE